MIQTWAESADWFAESGISFGEKIKFSSGPEIYLVIDSKEVGYITQLKGKENVVAVRYYRQWYMRDVADPHLFDWLKSIMQAISGHFCEGLRWKGPPIND